MIQKSYRYELKPSEVQKQLLERHFGCSRYIYNWALQKRIDAHKRGEKGQCWQQNSNELTQLKKQPEMAWLQFASCDALQHTLQCVDKAFTAFFEKRANFPKFKAKYTSKKSLAYRDAYIDPSEWSAQIPKIGKIKIYRGRVVDKTLWRTKTHTLTYTTTGRYFLSINLESQDEPLSKPVIRADTAVGIDMGIKDFIVLSNGTKISNPKHLHKQQRKIKVLQRRLSKKQKGSKRRQKAKLRVARLHEHVRWQRQDFLHKLSYRLCHENQVDTLCLEDLSVSSMAKDRRLAAYVSTAGWGTFKDMLKYKTDWYGKNLLLIGRFEPSSKMCSCCGFVNDALKLDQRIWTCSRCHAVLDRDLNAAQNIKNFALVNLLGPELHGPSLNKVQVSDSTLVESDISLKRLVEEIR